MAHGSTTRGFAPEQLIQELGTEIGPRPATSTAEARASAAVGARMRQIGLEVGIQTFSAAAQPTAGLALIALLGLLASLLAIWLPLPSLIFGLLLFCTAIYEIRGTGTLAALLKRQPSQNVIGSRAADGNPKGRIVLLCHLDSPRISSKRWIPYLRFQFVWVPLLCFVLMAVIGLQLWLNQDWWLLIGPIILFVFGLYLFGLHVRQTRWSHGAVDAAGVATALSVAEHTKHLEDLEVWVVALGAGAAGGAGLKAVLERYPFPHDRTWFINLPWLGRGTLTVVSREGWWRKIEADKGFLDLFHEIRSLSAPLDRRGYRGERLDSTRLLQRGFHALSLVGLRRDGTAAGFRRFDDLPDLLDVHQVTVAARLIVRALEQLTD